MTWTLQGKKSGALILWLHSPVALGTYVRNSRHHDMSALYQSRPNASQQIAAPFDHVAGGTAARLLPVLNALPNDALLKVNLIGQVVAPPNWRHLG